MGAEKVDAATKGAEGRTQVGLYLMGMRQGGGPWDGLPSNMEKTKVKLRELHERGDSNEMGGESGEENDPWLPIGRGRR